MKNTLLNEVRQLQKTAGLLKEDLESKITINIPENTSYQDFAKAVADTLKEDYGTHNFKPFLGALQAALSTDTLSEVSTEALERMDSLISQKALGTLINSAQVIIRDLKDDGFDDDDIFDFIVGRIKVLA